MKKKKTIKKQATPKSKAVKAVPAKENYTDLLLILVLTLIVYIPTFTAQFVNWDDPDYVNDTFYKSDFKTLFLTPIQGNYHPLTVLSLLLNFAISGMSPWSYHLLNLLLHLVNCFLVYRFVLLLSNSSLIAFITSLFFGIHPMHVESVAWVSERKDVLYSAFFIGGLICYTKFCDSGSRRQYIYSLLFLVLALASKPAAVIFPLALLCIDILRRRKLSTKLFLEKIPFIIFPLILGVITYIAQLEKGAVNTYTFPTGTRVLMGFYGIMMYFIKMVLPFRLSPFYPFEPINQPLPTEYYLAPMFFVALVTLCIYSWKRTRVVTFGILFYLINLLLILQFLPVGSAIIAERYTYIPYIGLFFIIGWVISKFAKANRKRAYFLVAPVAILWCILSYRQAAVWVTSASLWDQAIKINPSSRAYDNRARLFNDEKKFDKALEYYSESLKINAIDQEAYTNRGNIYFNSGKFDLAYNDYKRALGLDSNYHPVLDNMGALYATRRQYDSALISLNHALKINPKYVSAYRNRALTYLELKRYNEAISDFESFLKYQPNDPDILNAIGVCYRLSSRYQESLTFINKALAIKQDPHFYLNRSYVYFGLNNLEQARKDALTARQGGVEIDEPYKKSLGL